MFKNDNNVIEVPVTTSAGEAVPATDFTAATYTILNAFTSEVLFTATLGNGIEATRTHFEITTGTIDFVGNTYHEMRVRDIAGNESTLIQTTLKMNDTRITL